MSTDNEIELYLMQLRSGLVGMTVAERDEIIQEIRAHIRERTAQLVSVSDALSSLGPAEELAREYINVNLLRRARRSFSPWLILRTTFRWSMTGLYGFGLFLGALFGYAMGLGFIICALLKPLFPDETGMWVGPGVFDIGFRPGNVPAGKEILGPWFTQVALIVGAGLFFATTLVVRALVPKLKRWRDRARGYETLVDAHATQ